MTDFKLTRQRQGITIEQAALILDIPAADYERFEQGTFELSEAQLKKLAVFLRMDLDAKPKKKRKLNKRAREKRDRLQREIDPEFISEEELEEARLTMPDITEESLRFLKFIANLVVDITLEDVKQQEQLEKEPHGFHPERSLPCMICGDQVSGEKAWFDQNGQQCISCHEAIKTGIITVGEPFYKESELFLYFMLTRPMINRLIKEKHLIARKTARLRLFFMMDNPGFFPPKEHLQSAIVHDGNEYLFPPWYQLTDPNEHLKNYGIAKFLKWEIVQNSDKPGL